MDEEWIEESREKKQQLGRQVATYHQAEAPPALKVKGPTGPRKNELPTHNV